MTRDAPRFDRRTLPAAALATGGAAVLAAAKRGDTAEASLPHYPVPVHQSIAAPGAGLTSRGRQPDLGVPGH